MTLAQFLLLARQDVDTFETMWLQGVQASPEHYPDDMPVADWYDQFTSAMEL